MDRVCGGSLNSVRVGRGGYPVLCMGVLFSVLCSEGVLYKVFCVLIWAVTGSGVALFPFLFFSFFPFILHHLLGELSFQYGPYTRYLLIYG